MAESPPNVNSLIALQKDASVFKMLMAALATVLPNVAAGSSMAFTSIAIVPYRLENATSLDMPLNDEQTSWFVSIISISVMVGILSSGFVSEMIGIKLCIIFGCTLQAVAWLFVYFAKSFLILFLGRILAGIGSGLVKPASYVLLGDISLIEYRGMLASFNAWTLNMTFLFAFIVGACVPFDYFIPLSCTPLLVFFALCWNWLHESTTWNVKRHRIEAATKTLIAVRGPKYKVQAEIDELQELILKKQDDTSLKEKIAYLTSRPVLMPLGILVIMFAFQSSSGSDTITNYSLDIFMSSKLDIDPYILAIIVQGAFTLGIAISTPLLKRMLRKNQFVMSGVAMIISYIVLGVCLFYKDSTEEGSTAGQIFRYLAPISVISSALGYGVGFGPILYSMSSEIMPSRVKDICCSLCLASRYCFAFIFLKIFPAMESAIGLGAVFWFHSALCVIGTLFAFVFLPETQGKTLTEISELFMKKN